MKLRIRPVGGGVVEPQRLARVATECVQRSGTRPDRHEIADDRRRNEDSAVCVEVPERRPKVSGDARQRQRHEKSDQYGRQAGNHEMDTSELTARLRSGGMAALVHAFATVMHRFVALVAVVLISGFLPLAAGAGFCAAKPCCRSHAQASDFSLGAHPACCNETNCSTSSRDTEATVHAKRTVTHSPVVIAALITNVIPNHPVGHFAQRFNVGSPPTQRRLAALSILLI
jgi:hypothetical protein